jgi:hypothetical protein
MLLSSPSIEGSTLISSFVEFIPGNLQAASFLSDARPASDSEDTELRCLMEQEADIEKRRKFTREFKLEAGTFGWCYPIATSESAGAPFRPSGTLPIAYTWKDNVQVVRGRLSYKF